MPIASSDPPEGWSGKPWRLLFGLASNGVYMCPACYHAGGSLLHCLSTLTSHKEAVYFCCTGLGVTSTGRYPAFCPVKPGLSSPVLLRPRSPVLLVFNFILTNQTSISRLRLPEISVRSQTLNKLPPMNSRQIELLGTFSLSMPRKYSRNFRRRFAS